MNERIFSLMHYLSSIGQMCNVEVGYAKDFDMGDLDGKCLRYSEPLELFQRHNGADPYLLDLDRGCADDDKVVCRYNEDVKATEYFWPLS